MAIVPKVYHKYDTNQGQNRLVIDDTRIKHKDVFDMKYLYMTCKEWFMERQYAGKSEDKWPESLYLHRFQQSGGEEIWIWWRFRKEFNRMFRYDFDVDWHIIGLESTEIVKDGKKFKASKGECEFKIYVKLIFDPGRKMKKDSIVGSFYEAFWERMYFKDILAHRRRVYHDVYEFKQFIKQYFNLRQYLPEPEGHKFWLDENQDTPFYAPPSDK